MTSLYRLHLLSLLIILLLGACEAAGTAPTTTRNPALDTTMPTKSPMVETPTITSSPTGAVPPPTPTLPKPSPTMAACLFHPYGIGGEVPVFHSPDRNSEVLGEIRMGEKYPVLAQGGMWQVEDNNSSGHFYQIQLDESTSGWVIDMRGGLEGECAAEAAMATSVSSSPASTLTVEFFLTRGIEPIPPPRGTIYEDDSGIWLVESVENHRFLSAQAGLKLSPEGRRGLEILDGECLGSYVGHRREEQRDWWDRAVSFLRILVARPTQTP